MRLFEILNFKKFGFALVVFILEILNVKAEYNPYEPNGPYGTNCTWYAWQKAYEIGGVALTPFGNAKDWYNDAQNNGYPIWWGVAAWPVDTFVTSNDFIDKTVIPFCTSASSGLGQSGELLKSEAKGGNWLEGKRFSSNASGTDIKSWTDSLK